MPWQCEPGFYCVAGKRHPCPPGTFGSTYGLKTPYCSGRCPAGTFVLLLHGYKARAVLYRSDTPRAVWCSRLSRARPNCIRDLGAPCACAGYYCPINSTAPIECADNTYSTGGNFQCSVCPSAPLTTAINAHVQAEVDPLHPPPFVAKRCKNARICCNM